MPPVKPMLAKAVPEIPDAAEGELLFEPKWDGFRCIVFRDGDEVELGSAATSDRSPATSPSSSSRSAPRCRSAAWSTARWSSPARTGSTSTRSSSGSTRPSRGCNRLAAETPARFVAFDLLALDDRSLLEEPFRERRAELEQVLAAVEAPVHLTPVDDRPVDRAGLVRPLRGRRARRRDRQAAGRRLRARTSGCSSRSSTSAPRTASSPATARTRTARASARCSSASTTTTAGCTTWAWPARSARRGAASSSPRSRPTGPTTSRDHPWGEWADGRSARVGEPRAHAGCAVTLEREEGPVVHAAAPRAGGRGRLRAGRRGPLPPQRPPAPLAARPRPGRAARSTSSRWSRPTSCWRCSAPEPGHAGATRRILSSRAPVGGREVERAARAQLRGAEPTEAALEQGRHQGELVPSADGRRCAATRPSASATARWSSQAPHCEPMSHAAPDVATVGVPDDHAARTAFGNLSRSVMGRPSL